MICEIISIGTEILLGNIVNTNAQYLAKKLSKAGINVYYQCVVGDNASRIKNALDIAFSRSDIVITTGGLGPTKDDMTKEMLISYFGYKPVLDKKVLETLENKIAKLNIPSLSESMKKQAYVPENSIVMYNRNGTAPGCIMEKGDKICIILPGPPFEMKPMFEEYALPYLQNKSGKTIVSYIIQLLDFDRAPVAMVGEAPVAQRLGDILDYTNPSVATYTGRKDCKLRITASAKNKEEAIALVLPVVEECVKIIGKEYIDSIYEDDENPF